MADTYFTRTPGSAGNRRTFTWSAWLKRSGLGVTNRLWTAGTSIGTNNDNLSSLIFNSSNSLQFFGEISASVGFTLTTSQVFRDTSAWYHIVLAVDTTQSTASNRIKLYVNGSQVTDFSTETYMSQNYDTFYNATNLHVIGYSSTAATFNGYMAHVHFTDGTAYQASDFGETDTNGQWKPKSTPSVTYGTNGFFLKFANSGSLGTDSSGNGNNWTVSGSGDQVTDTPDNVFATLNPLNNDPSGGWVFTDGNCEFEATQANWNGTSSTQGFNTGKWYAEFKMTTLTTSSFIGIGSSKYLSSGSVATDPTDSGVSGNRYARYLTGVSDANEGKIADPTAALVSYGSNTGASTGDIISVALDLDNNKVYWATNGTWENSADPANNTNGFSINADTYQFGVWGYQAKVQANFGNPSFSITSGNTDDNGYGNFEYAPPTGYLALCTKNLASELTLPIGNGKDYFNTVLWTSNGSNATVTGVGFQPDFVWQKTRNAARHHHLYNSSRFTSGYGTWLQSSNADQEANLASTGLTSYSSDGFTHSFNSPQGFEINGETQVAWNWLNNGGTTSSNTDGTLTTTVQVNTTAGFSIVEWTGNGGGSTTVGHGLGVAPDMMIMHPLNVSTNWRVWHQDLSGGNYFLILDSTNGQNNNEPIFTGAPSSTVVNLGSDYNGNGTTYVMFAFTTKEGYSKFGGYTGNGSTDGPFVYTGFRPAFVMTKRTNAVGPWNMKDTKRPGYNDTDDSLFAESTATEDVRSFDILSNGFKLKNGGTEMNGGGSTYIYMAFAENPFVDSTGRPVTAR